MKNATKFLLEGDGTIRNCTRNIAQMTVIQLIKWQWPQTWRRICKETLDSILQILTGIWMLFVIIVLGPFAVLAWWPLIAAKNIRDARQEVHKEIARDLGSYEVYRVEYDLFKSNRLRRWLYNTIIMYFGLHRILGIPNYDFSCSDRENGDMVYYRVKEAVVK